MFKIVVKIRYMVYTIRESVSFQRRIRIMIDRNRLVTLLLSLSLVLVLSACNGLGSSNTKKEDAAFDEDKKLSSSSKSSEQEESAYPSKQINMIIPYGAGGTTDLTGRRLALALEKQFGQPIVVINQSGASGSVATKTVLDAKPDGYTIFYTADSLGTQRVMGLSDFSYDDFTPIMAVVDDPKVVVVTKDSKYDSLEGLVKDMQENKGKVKMSYTGPGGSGHVQALIYNELGLDMSLTAYSGGADCILAVLGNQVDFTNSNFSTVRDYIESGDLKLLGVASKTRLEAYPDVPTLLEVIPDAEKYLENPFTPLSLVIDKDCPDYVKTSLREAALKAVEDEEWKSFVKENSLNKLYENYPSEEDMDKFYEDWQSMVCWLLWDAGAAKNNPADFGIERLK